MSNLQTSPSIKELGNLSWINYSERAFTQQSGNCAFEKSLYYWDNFHKDEKLHVPLLLLVREEQRPPYLVGSSSFEP